MKLIAIDLDGTLLNSEGKISLESKEYLMDLRRQGYVIVIATGRSLKSAMLATDGAFFAHCIIASSGGVVFDNLNKKILKKENISYKTAQSILNLYDPCMSFIEIADLEYYNRYCKTLIEDSNEIRKINNMFEFLENKNDIFYICIEFKNDKYAERINKYILKKFDELDSITVHSCHSDKIHIEMFKKGVSKYKAVSYIARLCDIPDENIIAFGDSENDLDLIKNSGVGVAMNNAIDMVKENAKYITKTNDENGVIEFLKLYL